MAWFLAIPNASPLTLIIMKKNIAVLQGLLLLCLCVTAQKKPAPKGPPSPAAINKMMEQQLKKGGIKGPEADAFKEAMNGMMTISKEDIGVIDVYEDFADNKLLLPERQTARIKTIAATYSSDEEVAGAAKKMYEKLVLKLPAGEKSEITRIVSAYNNAGSLHSAAVTALLQGRRQVALGLALKAVGLENDNLVYQNNVAAILTENGYPENAIPFLRKLNREVVNNGTVLNNLGFAWFNLGEQDSARQFLSAAVAVNPENPEPGCGNGVIDEVKGDPVKAGNEYDQGWCILPNSLFEKMANNAGKTNLLDKLDFDKIKKSIPVYEYFNTDWVKMPVLDNRTADYDTDLSNIEHAKSSHDEVVRNLEKIEKDSSDAFKEIRNKTRQQQQISVMASVAKGHNIMARNAAYILAAVNRYIDPWIEQFGKELEVLASRKDQLNRELSEKEMNTDNCESRDKLLNQYMETINPEIKKFYEKKLEEFRVWLNAYCTYMRYLGNPKKSILLDCISWLRVFNGLYLSAVGMLDVRLTTCPREDILGSLSKVVHLKIPDFKCRLVFNVPAGKELISFSQTAKGFDNSFDIQKQQGQSTPNMTIAMGSGSKDIAEPGKAGQPYYKMSEGGMCIPGYGDYDPEHPVSPQAQKIKDRLKAAITEDCTDPDENKKPKPPAPKKNNHYEDDVAPLTPVVNNGVQNPGSNKAVITGLFK
jgi:tetratricopeptide (TPR) repeat protein